MIERTMLIFFVEMRSK